MTRIRFVTPNVGYSHTFADYKYLFVTFMAGEADVHLIESVFSVPTACVKALFYQGVPHFETHELPPEVPNAIDEFCKQQTRESLDRAMKSLSLKFDTGGAAAGKTVQ